MNSKRKSIENGRAKAAYDYVDEVVGEEFAGDYKSYVKKLASLIKTNGLGNTVAFINSKGHKAYEQIYKQLEKWLKEKNLIENNLLKEITEMESGKYRHLTKETLALLNWWRRFVDGRIDNE